MLYLGSDHAGFQLKQAIIRHLKQKNIPYHDCGNTRYDATDDYPQYAFLVGRQVAQSDQPKNPARGILVCDSAIGMVIAANKIPGIRAAHIFNAYTAQQSKSHDDVNIAVFSAKLTSTRKAIQLIHLWLSTPKSRDTRHRRRIQQIHEQEKQNM